MLRLERLDTLYPQRGKCEPFFCEGAFLSIAQVEEALEKVSAAEQRVPAMLQVLRDARWRYPDMLHLYQSLEAKRFPVSHLSHVTTWEHFQGILEEGGLRGCQRAFPLQGQPRALGVSCWGAAIPYEDIESAKRRRFWELAQAAEREFGFTLDHLGQEEVDEVQDMLANSPAMRPDSRYGNFRFTFRVKELLAAYSEQHCGGEKPVLRVLGTEAHTLEIVHWILIHSPQCKDFHHLPTVDPPGPFSRDGNLMWAPESLTDQFTWEVNHASSALQRKPFAQTYNAWVWNNPVFAFHLPGDGALWMGRRWLLENVEACETAQSFGGTSTRILRHPKGRYVSLEDAERIIYDEQLPEYDEQQREYDEQLQEYDEQLKEFQPFW